MATSLARKLGRMMTHACDEVTSFCRREEFLNGPMSADDGLPGVPPSSEFQGGRRSPSGVSRIASSANETQNINDRSLGFIDS